MLGIMWFLVFLIAFLVVCFQRASLIVSTILFAVLLLLLTGFGHAGGVGITALWIVFAAIFIPLNALPLRRQLLSRIVLVIFKKLMPNMSATEREALTAGDVGWEANLLGGMPDWQQLHAMPEPSLTGEEQDFLDGPVTQLCNMINSWEINRAMQIPEELWTYIREQGFFGMIIPKQYGGREFSAVMHSQVIAKISSVCTAVATVVSVPNSLGPAELLLKYGTEQQKSYFLPRLAAGEEVPCFALTSPSAGSDAGSIEDYGVVFKAVIDGEEQLAIRLHWNKRYITLAPVATLIGLAFKLFDPEHLLGEQEDIGITCALIPSDIKGVTIGRRHYPLGSAFPNGPIQGDGVVVPITAVIGGQARVGQGWRMLMECLAAGRSISLPSMAAGTVIKAALSSGAYARIRRQFNTYIGDFGGVQEALARVVGNTYMVEALRLFAVTELDHDCVAVVASAVSKYNTTDLGRKIMIDAMDIHGGKGICMGEKNYLAQSYIEAPISITVEGANILTRSMIIFGQGVMRCHPHLLNEISALEADSPRAELKLFDQALWQHIGFFMSNKIRTVLLSLSGGRLASAPRGPMRRYYQQLSRFIAALGLAADVALLNLGGELKRREMISGRLGDLLSLTYIGSAVLKYHHSGMKKGALQEEQPIIEWICQTILFQLQTQMDAFLDNLPNRLLSWLVRKAVFPLGRHLRPPKDHLTQAVARSFMEPGAVRDRLAASIDYSVDGCNPVGRMEDILVQSIAAEPLAKKLQKARYKGKISGMTYEQLIASAVESGVFTANEANQLLDVYALRMTVINVDDFDAKTMA